MLLKIKENVRSDWETALAWAVSTKNALMNNKGFSPMQILFGRNPNLPGSLTIDLPALESKPEISIVSTHLAALKSARQEFIKAESSEKIKQAPKKQTRQWKKCIQNRRCCFLPERRLPKMERTS